MQTVVQILIGARLDSIGTATSRDEYEVLQNVADRTKVAAAAEAFAQYASLRQCAAVVELWKFERKQWPAGRRSRLAPAHGRGGRPEWDRC